MKSERTKKLKKTYKLFSFLSWFLAFGTAAGFVIYLLFSKSAPSQGNASEVNKILANYVFSIAITVLPMIVLALIVKDKIKPLIWVANIILANIVIGDVAMYIVFALYLSETYIFTPLASTYKTKYIVNKEIDLRESI